MKISSIRGFTLIELLITLSILGVLAATAMPKFINMRREARIAALHGMEAAVRSAITLSQSAFALTNVYPDVEPWLSQGKAGMPIEKTGNSSYGLKDFPINIEGKIVPVAVTIHAEATVPPSGDTVILPGGIPQASIERLGVYENGIVKLLRGMENCTHELGFIGSWQLSNCEGAGFSLAYYNGNAQGPMQGLFFYPPGVKPQEGFDNTYLDTANETACYLKYATAMDGPPRYISALQTEPDESAVVIRLETRGC